VTNASVGFRTYAAVRLHIDSWRWDGVPFFVRAGEALARSNEQERRDFRLDRGAEVGRKRKQSGGLTKLREWKVHDVPEECFGAFRTDPREALRARRRGTVDRDVHQV
jgi:hypothetical protein